MIWQSNSVQFRTRSADQCQLVALAQGFFHLLPVASTATDFLWLVISRCLSHHSLSCRRRLLRSLVDFGSGVPRAFLVPIGIEQQIVEVTIKVACSQQFTMIALACQSCAVE